MVLEIEKAVKHLKKGGIIIYPSDTIWAIGCDATNQSSIDKIYNKIYILILNVYNNCMLI